MVETVCRIQYSRLHCMTARNPVVRRVGRQTITPRVASFVDFMSGRQLPDCQSMLHILTCLDSDIDQ